MDESAAPRHDEGMQTPYADLLDASVRSAGDTLRALADHDWSRPATDSEWSCRDVLVHVVDDLLFYAGSVLLASTERRFIPIEATPWEPDTPIEQLVDALGAYGAILRLVVLDTPSTSRGFHVYGVSDPEGFAAMGAVEVLVHAWDVTRAHGSTWRPDPGQCRPLVDRLFPEAPSVENADAADILLWCTGRQELDGLPRRESWTWDGRPLADR